MRRNYEAMGFWLWSPAVAHPFRTLMWALEDLAKERKVEDGQGYANIAIGEKP